jgi:SAM-dependent methyltransferase
MGIKKAMRESGLALNLLSVATLPIFWIQLTAATLRDRKERTGQTYEPAPPPKLRWRVSANLDRTGYLEAGKEIAQNIRDCCEIAGREFDSYTDILDFGSGSGRIIQNFRGQSPLCTLYATDIDPELVGWGKANLPGIQWSVNEHQPPLPFGNDSFDLIYGSSVFTHLPEDLQHTWLRELHRVARPGATIILSVHGEYAMSKQPGMLLDDSSRDEVRQRGFMFFKWTSGIFKRDGFPDFYQTAFHTKEYIYNEWSNYFDVLDYIERGFHGFQDAVIMRKSTAHGSEETDDSA